MPTYQYACTTCGHQLEAVQSFADEPLTHCPACSGRLRKLFSAVGIVFKGSGFYRNDSRVAAEGDGSPSAPAKEGVRGDGSSSAPAKKGARGDGSSSSDSSSGGSGGAETPSTSGSRTTSSKSPAPSAA